MPFEQLYRANVAFVRACLCRFGVPFEDVDEACHTIFMALLKQREPIRTIRPWLFVASRLEARKQRSRRAVDVRRSEAIRHLCVLLPRQNPPDSREMLRDFLVELMDGSHPEALALHKLIWQLERVLGDVTRALGVAEDDVLKPNPSSPTAMRAFSVLCWLFHEISGVDDARVGVLLGRHPQTIRWACRLVQTEIKAGYGLHLFALQRVLSIANTGTNDRDVAKTA